MPPRDPPHRDERPEDQRFPLTGREFTAVVAFWVAFAVFRVADRVFAEPDLPALAWRLLPAAAESLGWIACTPLVVALVERCVARRRRAVVQAALYLGVGLLAAVPVSAAGVALRMRAADRARGPAAPRRLSPPYWFWVGDAFAVYLGVLGAALTRAYVLRYRTQREQAALLEARLAAARLEALRRQLDPHFLFNTLSLVTSLVDRDPPGARRMIARLSDLLRVSLADGGEPEVPLHQELALVDLYLDIMRVRFAGRLAVDVHVDPEARDALVPPLLLQPLVENAVKHGVERARGPGRIAIEAVRQGGAMVLRVRDTGPGDGTRGDGTRDAVGDGTGHGVGLRNTTARLEQLYGGDARLARRPAAGGGTEVEVRLPLRAAPAQVPATAPEDAGVR